MAHVILNLRDWKRSTDYYRALLTHLGLSLVSDSDNGLGSYDTLPFLYYVGGKTAVGFHQAAEEFRGLNVAGGFNQRAPGLHHFCLRARSKDVVDGLGRLHSTTLVGLGGKLIRPPSTNDWANGYYSILLEDPEGMHIEVNYIPGRGLLAMDAPEVGASTATDAGTPVSARTCNAKL